MESPKAALCKSAVNVEIDALLEADTYSWKTLPEGSKPVDAKWVFSIKENPSGQKLYKARVVARGFLQELGVNYLDTFAPVVKHKSLKLLFGIAAMKNWSIHQMDVKGAFLNGDIDADVFVIPPAGAPKGPEGKVWHL